MNCGRINLKERTRKGPTAVRESGRPHRYCEQLLVDPDHDNSNVWTQAIMERYYQSCPPNVDADDLDAITQPDVHQSNYDDLYLTVQTLKFQGDVQEHNRPRTSFKYKAPNKETTHRLFVKEVVIEEENHEESDESSRETNSQIDQYLDYVDLINTTRPSTTESNNFNTRRNSKENKAIQVRPSSLVPNNVATVTKNNKSEKRNHCKNNVKSIVPSEKDIKKENLDNTITAIEDSKIAFHKFNKRKSLTISRAQSPETVQVIRVDVVCNYSIASSTITVHEELKQRTTDIFENNSKALEDLKKSRFAHKYLLAKSIKSLDANLSGGAKVTLLCKTFRLAKRHQRK